jgi:hypothetical protein
MEGVEIEKEFIDVMYNAKYGGFSFSDEAEALYYQRTMKDKKDFPMWNLDRTDLCMVSIVKELGSRANGLGAKIQIRAIPKKFKKFYFIAEYDGYESVSIDHDKYKLACIREVLETFALTSDGKLERIGAIIAEKSETDSDGEGSSDHIYDNESFDGKFFYME